MLTFCNCEHFHQPNENIIVESFVRVPRCCGHSRLDKTLSTWKNQVIRRYSSLNKSIFVALNELCLGWNNIFNICYSFSLYYNKITLWVGMKIQKIILFAIITVIVLHFLKNKQQNGQMKHFDFQFVTNLYQSPTWTLCFCYSYYIYHI